MKINSSNRLFIPGFFILTVVFLLILFTGWSTWLNLNRDRKNALQQLIKEGELIFHSMEADVRGRIMGAMWSDNCLKDIMLHTSQNKDIAYLYYKNSKGDILCNSIPLPTPEEIEVLPIPAVFQHNENRMIKLKDGKNVLEIRRYLNFDSIGNEDPHSRVTENDHHLLPGKLDALPVAFETVIGLYMTDYENVRQADLHHAMIMMAILASLGAGGIFFLFVIKKHLSDLKQIKRLEYKVRKSEKHAEIGKLAAAVAHEIRNPLSSIKGFAQFLSHLLKDDPQNCEYATIMVKELDRINRVITDLLTFARPLEIRKLHIDPMELIEHTVLLVEGDSKYKNISIETDIQINMKSIYIDIHQMTQVLLNLVLNSLRELDMGQKLVIGAANNYSKGDTVIWVEDDGPGIPEDYHDKIFDPFFTRHEKGTGLGLAISKKIVENHGGEILVKSPLHGSSIGCRFIITIPFENNRHGRSEVLALGHNEE
ncbi:MAG: hypothetical protein HQK65_03660 [Desulfamplus sp.]|nr:hypothetical protein [Desulfamplus sp.]